MGAHLALVDGMVGLVVGLIVDADEIRSFVERGERVGLAQDAVRADVDADMDGLPEGLRVNRRVGDQMAELRPEGIGDRSLLQQAVDFIAEMQGGEFDALKLAVEVVQQIAEPEQDRGVVEGELAGQVSGFQVLG